MKPTALTYIPQQVQIVADTPLGLANARARALAVEKGLSINDVSLMELVYLVRIKTNQSSYRIELSDPGEHRQNKYLATNDLFVTNLLSLAVGTPKHPDPSKGHPLLGNAIWHYHPNPAVFTAGAVTSLTQAECLEALYNGEIKISSDNDTRVKTLYTGALRHDETRASEPHNGGNAPFMSFEAPMVFRGGPMNVIELFLSGVYDAFEQDARAPEFFRLVLRGFIINGGANKLTAADLRV
jgi:hypothetical protein